METVQCLECATHNITVDFAVSESAFLDMLATAFEVPRIGENDSAIERTMNTFFADILCDNVRTKGEP